MSTVLLTGATGFVGSHLVEALRQAGHTVRCASRAPAQARARAPALDWVELDLLRPDTLGPALAGCDAAVFLVHGMGPGMGTQHGDDYPARERAGAQAFAAAAAAAGVRRIVYLGGVVPATGASRHLQSRQRTGEILRAGPVETIELRAAMVIGAGSASWIMVRDLARRLPAMVLPRWLRNTSWPIAIDDVVVGIVAALALPGTGSRVFELPGPERLTHRDVLIRAAAAMGHRRVMINVPILTPRLSSYWIALVTRTSLAMAKELVEGVRANLEPTGTVLWDHVAHRPMRVDDAIRRALADEPPAGGGAAPAPARRGDARATALGVVTVVLASIGFGLAVALRARCDPWRTTAGVAAVGVGLSLLALGSRARALFVVTWRGVVGAIALGVALVGATHLAFRALGAASPALALAVHTLYRSIDVGSGRLRLALITALVVLCEELVWRGVVIELLGTRRAPAAVAAISVILYALPQVAGAVPLLAVAALGLGAVFTAQRLATGRLTEPLVTHAVWSVAVFVLLPLA